MNLYIPTESDFRRWVKEAVRESLDKNLELNGTSKKEEEPLLSRKEVAYLLSISLVTLHDRMKRGLPFHKQRGRVYFIRSEVVEYIKTKQLGPYGRTENFKI